MQASPPSLFPLSVGCPLPLQQAAGVSDTSSSSGIVGGPADVAKLRICLDTLGDVLGTPALRVMTQQVMAGALGGWLGEWWFCWVVAC